MLSVKPVSTDLQGLGNIFPAKTARRILISAVNDAARWGETRLNKLIRDTIAASRKSVDDAITRRTTRDDEGGFGQRVRVTRVPIDLKEYNPRQTKSGISVRMLKGGKREQIRHAFIAAAVGSQAFKRAGKKRLPIRKLKGPTAVGALARRDDDVNQISGQVADRLLDRAKSKMDYELSKTAKYL